MKRDWQLSDPEVQESKRVFEEHGKRYGRKGVLCYDELFELHRNGISFATIAKADGVKKQAVHQQYKRHFEQFFGTRRVWGQELASRSLSKKKAKERRTRLQQALSDPVFLFVRTEAEKRGHTIQPVVDFEDLKIARGKHPVFQVGKKYLRVHRRTKEERPNPREDQRYISFQISLVMLEGIHVYGFLVDVPNEPRQLFLVPSRRLREVLIKKGVDSWGFYANLGDCVPRKRNGTLKLNPFKDAWVTLE